jgi:hypothetical protein
MITETRSFPPISPSKLTRILWNIWPRYRAHTSVDPTKKAFDGDMTTTCCVFFQTKDTSSFSLALDDPYASIAATVGCLSTLLFIDTTACCFALSILFTLPCSSTSIPWSPPSELPPLPQHYHLLLYCNIAQIKHTTSLPPTSPPMTWATFHGHNLEIWRGISVDLFARRVFLALPQNWHTSKAKHGTRPYFVKDRAFGYPYPSFFHRTMRMIIYIRRAHSILHSMRPMGQGRGPPHTQLSAAPISTNVSNNRIGEGCTTPPPPSTLARQTWHTDSGSCDDPYWL